MCNVLPNVFVIQPLECEVEPLVDVRLNCIKILMSVVTIKLGFLHRCLYINTSKDDINILFWSLFPVQSLQLGCACTHSTCSPETCDHVYLFNIDYDNAKDIYGKPMHGRFPYDEKGRLILEVN